MVIVFSSQMRLCMPGGAFNSSSLLYSGQSTDLCGEKRTREVWPLHRGSSDDLLRRRARLSS